MNDIRNRDDVVIMVDSFYNLLRKNERLNYLFEEVAHVNWDSHLKILYEFWDIIIFNRHRIPKNPLNQHLELHQKEKMTKNDFDMWTEIFIKNMDANFKGEVAEATKAKAVSMANLLMLRVVNS